MSFRYDPGYSTCFAAASLYEEPYRALCGAPAVGLDPLSDWPACAAHGGLGRCKACGRPLAVEACPCDAEPVCEVCLAQWSFLRSLGIRSYEIRIKP